MASLACGAFASAATPASITSPPTSIANPAAAPDADAFDALLERIGSHGNEEDLNDAAYQRNRRRLVALLPPHDAARAARLDAFDCYQFAFPPDQMLVHAEAGIARSLAASRTLRMEYMLCKSYALYSLGRPYTASLLELLALTDARTSPRLRAAALLLRSFHEGDTGHYAQALATQREALGLDIKRGVLRSAQLTNTLIAETFGDMGLYQAAADILQAVVRESRANNDPALLSVALEKLGRVHEGAGNIDAALAAMRESARIERALGGGDSLAAILLRIAQIHADQGDLADARRIGEQARAEMARTGSLQLLAPRLDYLEASVAFKAGNTASASASLQDAMRRWRTDGALRPLSDALNLQAGIDRSMRRWQAALDAREEQIRIRQELDTRMQREQARFLAAELDNSRRDIENQRLQQKADLQSRELRSAQREQRLRLMVIVLLALLLAAMAATLALTRKRLRGARNDAMTDSLTGIGSRRQILKALAQLLQDNQAISRPLSVLAIDIDHFKQINDLHGHAAGDEVLRRVSDACRHALRQTDPFGRTGGEEFLALLPGTAIVAAIQLAQRVREMVADLPLDDIAQGLRATISIGVAEATTGQESADELLARADAALYQAKHNGRNRVEVAATTQ